MSIGVVMFFKSLILAIGGGIWEWWLSFKKRHTEKGLPMRMGKDGVFRAYNWPEIFERRARAAWWACAVLFYATLAVVVILSV